MTDKEKKLVKVEEELNKLEKNENTVYFLIIDTKGNPSGSLQYIYRMALSLKNEGFKVEMLHQEKDFVGPFEWLGEEYKELTHRNVEEENVEVSVSDIIIVPEVYANTLTQISDFPCRKIMLIQNFEYLTEFMPFSATFERFGIKDVITTSERQKEQISKCFPYLNVYVLEPGVGNMFRASEKPRKLIVNVVSRDQYDINRFVKPFYWKYPIYKWISFRDLRGVTQEVFSEALRESAFTIWIDEPTNFGYSAVEALKCGTILIAKIPDNPTDWMVNENGELIDEVLWFENLRDLPDFIASLVRSWTLDVIPSEIYDGLKILDNSFTMAGFNENCKKLFKEEIIPERIEELKRAMEIFKINDEKSE